MTIDKRIELEQLGRLISPGDTVGLGGAWQSNHPMAAVRQLLRERIGDLHVVGSLLSIDVDLLIGAGLVRELTFSMVSLEVFGLAPSFRRAVEAGTLAINEVSGVAITVGLEAGARRLPFLPMRGIGDSELVERAPQSYSQIRCPFTGDELLAVRALRPDVTIIHARRADPAGNAQVDGPLADDRELARAADRVIVTCERLVDHDVILAAPATTHVPGFLVEAVIEAPYGAHPTSHVPEYGLDAWTIGEYADACADDGGTLYRAGLAGESEASYRERVLSAERRTVLRETVARAEVLGASL